MGEAYFLRQFANQYLMVYNLSTLYQKGGNLKTEIGERENQEKCTNA